MKTSTLQYLNNLLAGAPSLKERLDRCFKYWDPEVPPTTIVFGEVGTAIAENMKALSPEALTRIFSQIEEGMTHESSELREGVGTGLIEALVAAADKQPELWLHLDRMLGAASSEHAAAWRKFGR